MHSYRALATGELCSDDPGAPVGPRCPDGKRSPHGTLTLDDTVRAVASGAAASGQAAMIGSGCANTTRRHHSLRPRLPHLASRPTGESADRRTGRPVGSRGGLLGVREEPDPLPEHRSIDGQAAAGAQVVCHGDPAGGGVTGGREGSPSVGCRRRSGTRRPRCGCPTDCGPGRRAPAAHRRRTRREWGPQTVGLTTLGHSDVSAMRTLNLATAGPRCGRGGRGRCRPSSTSSTSSTLASPSSGRPGIRQECSPDLIVHDRRRPHLDGILAARSRHQARSSGRRRRCRQPSTAFTEEPPPCGCGCCPSPR
jgi:hypothetical protein